MELHIGVDSQSDLAHSAIVTPANVHHKHLLPDLLHCHEQRVYGDSGLNLPLCTITHIS
jgi:IS5 family transposase